MVATALSDRIFHWGPWVFSFALVIIGYIGIRYAKRTLDTIKEQATLMKRQADTMDQQAADARKSGADAAVVAVGTLKAIEVQATLMQSQETLLRDTAQRQLRAYICVDAAMLKFTGTGDNESFEVQVDIKNSGQTPAYDLHLWAHVWVEQYPLKVDLPEPPQDFRMSSSIIAPGGKTIMVSGPGQSIHAPIVTLGNPSRTVYAYGKICYRDAFGKNRTTRYRFFYGGNEPPRRKTDREGRVIGLLQPDAEGNEAD
jgi:hypothetical protein